MSKITEELIKKYLANSCTPEERAMLDSWYNSAAGSAHNPQDDINYQQLEKEIWSGLKKTAQPLRKINWFLLTAAAACLLVFPLFYFFSASVRTPQAAGTSAKNILPGGNKAELLLEDGSVLTLTDGSSGLLARQNGAQVTSFKGGRLTYGTTAAAVGDQITYNMLSTPRGGQYQIELPDGTRAWLNAASSLKFPTAFNGTDRVVEATGEVYFEVAVNKEKPFKVISAGQTVVVLGTHFNVNAYADEPSIRTSLMEGSVRVVSARGTVVIKPGEQSIFDHDNQGITVRKSDMEEVLAWRKGYFEFNNENIKSIMRKLSRWYDIDVDYSKDFVDQGFNGSVSRFKNASEVLRMLELTGTIHFKTTGRRIMVMP